MGKNQMSAVIAHSFFFLIGSLLFAMPDFSEVTVLFILMSLIAIGLMVVFSQSWVQKVLFIGGLIACVQWPALLWYLPAAVSVLLIQELTKTAFVLFSLLVGLICLFQDVSGWEIALVLLLSAFAIYLAENRRQQQAIVAELLALKDDSWEQRRQLEDKNSELVVSQEASIALEVTQERNRIARDIHDNVGHLLSSALIQLGAIQTINRQENLENPLLQLHATIDLGMNNIRSSVHNTFQDSLDFSQGLEILLRDFTFCPVVVEGSPAIIPKHLAQPLTMIFKEALANVMKHSNATEVKLVFSELPAFYKCIIQDNGTLPKETEAKGIGLIGMQQRLKKFDGQLHVNARADGFMLNIILPKGREKGREEEGGAADDKNSGD